MTKLTSTKGIEMLSEMPPYYQTSRVMTEGILEPEGKQFDELYGAILSVAAQFFARTATWGLNIWEYELGITRLSATETINERRDRIIAKERASGTATIWTIENAARSYNSGSIQAIPDPIEGVVIIRFIDARGIPSNIEDFKKNMREIIPSHFEIIYDYNLLTWNEFDAFNLTWDQFDALNITWDELEVLKL